MKDYSLDKPKVDYPCRDYESGGKIKKYLQEYLFYRGSREFSDRYEDKEEELDFSSSPRKRNDGMDGSCVPAK